MQGLDFVCKDIKDQDCTIRYAVYNKLEFLINNSKISFECFPDVNILTKIKGLLEWILSKQQEYCAALLLKIYGLAGQ